MKKINSIFIVGIFLISKISYSGEINHVLEYDIDNNGKLEKILFIDDFNKDYHDFEFNRLIIIRDLDSLTLNLPEICIPKPNLYQNADYNLDDRIGLFRYNNSTFFWLTSYDADCCLNHTIIYRYTNNGIEELLFEAFEFESVVTSDNNRYFVGSTDDIEFGQGGYAGYGWVATGKTKPLGVYAIHDNFKEDMQYLNVKINEKFSTFKNDDLDFNDCYIINCYFLNKQILASENLVKKFGERDYAIASIAELTPEILKDFDKNELRLMENELYAIYGYKFESEDLNNHFMVKKWYKPQTDSIDEIVSKQTELEKRNIDLIKSIEKKR